MAAVESAHDTTAKILLNGTTLPAGQTAEQDLAGALGQHLRPPQRRPLCLPAAHPAPRLQQSQPCLRRPHLRRLRQQRHAVRGDMQAVIRAILEDSEARAGDTNPLPTAATSASPCST